MKRKTNPIIKVLVIALVIGGIIFLVSYFSRGKETDITPEVVPTKTESTESEAEITSTKKSINENEELYSITASYPVLSGFKTKEITSTVNESIKESIDAIVSQLKENANEPTIFDDPESKTTLSVSYKIVGKAHGMYSLYFEVSEYLSGAAHPNSYTLALVYDISTGEKLSISNLCTNEESCVESFVPIARTGLKKEFKAKNIPYDSWADDGSSADDINYQHFVVTESTLDIFFNPYQVGPYALGVVRVKIPYGDLSVILKAKYK